jgi:hypothetical protein
VIPGFEVIVGTVLDSIDVAGLEGPKKALSGVWFKSVGTCVRKDKSLRQRFKCLSCGKTFSDATFDMNYRFRRRGRLNARIFHAAVHSRSNRSIAREIKSSECLVRTRLMRLFRLGIVKHGHILDHISIGEEVAYDGLEAFAHSQYEPNNVNHVVGASSLFTYLFNFAPMNRKGRMSDRQRVYLEKIEQKQGRFDPRAIRVSTRRIFKEVVNRKSSKLSQVVIRSDEHFQYRKAMGDLEDRIRNKIIHDTVSSKAVRNFKNILFAVNHVDLLIRKDSAAFARETICFAKKHSRMMHKYFLIACYKNYMKPQFVKKQVRNLTATTDSPAMKLEICDKLLSFRDYFQYRNPVADISKLPLDWKLLYKDRVAFTRSMKYLKKDQVQSGLNLQQEKQAS